MLQVANIEIVEAAEHHLDDILRAASESRLSKWNRADYTNEIGKPGSIFLVARKRTSGTVGFIVGRLVPDASSDLQTAEIHNIAVLNQFRRIGIGSLLIDSFIKLSKRQGAKEALLEVRAGNEAAIRFYKRHDFESYYSRSAYYSDPVEDATLMRTKL